MTATVSSGRDLTRLNEGCRLVAYDDRTGMPIPPGARPQGTMTIGWGHTGPEVVPGLTWKQAQADAVFESDYANAQRAAGRDLGLDDWSRLDVCRQAVLVDMAYEEGARGLARFGQMLEFVRRGNWVMAAQALQASKLFRQVPTREKRNVSILMTGQWPGTSPFAKDPPAPPAAPEAPEEDAAHIPDPHAAIAAQPLPPLAPSLFARLTAAFVNAFGGKT